MISEMHPDLLIACFGCPKQEKWIYENIEKYDAKVSICAGATVDFLAGNVKRAPRWMSEHGLEWFYRFLQEPKRMFKRYFVDDIKIVKLIFKYAKKEKNEWIAKTTLRFFTFCLAGTMEAWSMQR